jgi:hypothetical protein
VLRKILSKKDSGDMQLTLVQRLLTRVNSRAIQRCMFNFL